MLLIVYRTEAGFNIVTQTDKLKWNYWGRATQKSIKGRFIINFIIKNYIFDEYAWKTHKNALRKARRLQLTQILIATCHRQQLILEAMLYHYY